MFSDNRTPIIPPSLVTDILKWIVVQEARLFYRFSWKPLQTVMAYSYALCPEEPLKVITLLGDITVD